MDVDLQRPVTRRRRRVELPNPVVHNPVRDTSVLCSISHTGPTHVCRHIHRNHHRRDYLCRGPYVSPSCRCVITEGNRSLTPVRTPSLVSVHHSPTWSRVTQLPSNSTKRHCFFPFMRSHVFVVMKVKFCRHYFSFFWDTCISLSPNIVERRSHKRLCVQQNDVCIHHVERMTLTIRGRK